MAKECCAFPRTAIKVKVAGHWFPAYSPVDWMYTRNSLSAQSSNEWIYNTCIFYSGSYISLKQWEVKPHVYSSPEELPAKKTKKQAGLLGNTNVLHVYLFEMFSSGWFFSYFFFKDTHINVIHLFFRYFLFFTYFYRAHGAIAKGKEKKIWFTIPVSSMRFFSLSKIAGIQRGTDDLGRAAF